MGLLPLRATLLLVLLGTLAPVVSAQADFSIGVSPSSQTVWQAWTVNSLVTITPLNGFSGTVGFTTSGLPAGATASFNPATVSSSGVTTMTISAGPGVPTGSYGITVTGTSGSLSHNAGVSLSVVVPPPISYTYDAAGRLTSVTDQLGSSAVYNYDAVGNVLSISRQNAGTVTISAFSPASGPVGTVVTILGSGFSATLNQNSVQFNGVAATVTAASNALLTAIVPSGATTGLITVSVSGGMPATSSSSFTVTSTPGAPTITSVTPSIVTQGVGITVAGTNFSTNLASNTVTVAATPLPVQGATTSSISTSAPVVSGSGHVSVQTPYGTATSTDDLFFVPSPYTEASVALAARATLGTPVTTTFSSTKTLAILIFDATQGQKARLLFNASQNPTAAVYDPTGAVLLPDTFVANHGSAAIDTPTFGSNGTYTVYIKGTTSAQGKVSFTLVNPAPAGDFSLSAVPEFYQNYPTGPAFTVFVNAGTGLSGSVQLSASGLPGCATPAFNPTSRSTSGGSRLSFTLTGCAAGSYTFTVTGTVGALSRSINVTLNVNPLPAGWSEGNINNTGYAEYSGGTFTVNGGPGPYNPNDVSHFVYQTLNGDGSIVARIVSNYTAPDNPQQAFGGVMIRENLTTGSSAKLMNLRLASQAGAQLLWEPPTGNGGTSSLILPGISAPYWLKISRQGNTFLAFMAPDGSNWTQVSSATTISMASSVLIGLTAANTNQGTVAQVVFDNVTITSSPDFSNTVTPSSQSVVPGGTANYTESIGALSGFTGTVTFAASGLPSGTTATFTPSSVSGSGTSTLAVVTTGSTPFGSYPLIITATSGSLAHVTNVTLTVASADFSISASPSSRTINVNGNTTYTLTVSALNGFANTVNLSIAGVPTGASATVNPTSVTGSGTATVSVTAGADTPQRTYQLTFVGTSGSLIHLANANLVVTPADFSMSLNTGWMLFPAAGGQASRTLTLTPANAFTKTVTLSATGLPPGTTAAFNPPTVTTSGTSTVTITTPAGLAPGLLTANIVGTVIDTQLGNPSHFIPISLITQPDGTLPSPWVNQDIGSVGITGSSGYSNGAFTVQASGLGITGTSDQFQFLNQPFTGDGTIIARLVSLQNPTGNSRVGVMIRETLAANSAHALMGFQGLPDSGNNRATNFFTRPSTGATTTSSNGTNNPTTPVWFKLTRQGSTFTGWYSTDGFSWTQQSAGWTATIPMASAVYIGIAVGDDNNNAVKTAVFDNVTVTGAAVMPTFNPAPGSYSSSVTISISTVTPGASIRYTLDGSTPTSSSGTLYSGSITVNTTTTIKAIAYKTGMTDSGVASATYTIP
ncbi:MAG: chitobiase/beta-hexosaminidase C-terminal domain-containing protein [Acidobacteriia bacterium]|nr:chitobiase/beta-hexosaminidase C-terminal domain-containing protein [Terriglobia bacterium]